AVVGIAGSVGCILPPSIPVIMFGRVGGVYIGGLFLGGVIPGLIIGFALMLVSFISAKKRYFPTEGKFPTFVEVLKAINYSKWALLIPVIILGVIYSGFFSLTESVAVACVYALIIEIFVYMELSFRD